MEKENEEYDAKEGGGRKTGAAKTPGAARPRAQAAGEGAPPARVLVSPYDFMAIGTQADCTGPTRRLVLERPKLFSSKTVFLSSCGSLVLAPGLFVAPLPSKAPHAVLLAQRWLII